MSWSSVIFHFFKGNTLKIYLELPTRWSSGESSLLRGLLVRSHSIFDGPKHPVRFQRSGSRKSQDFRTIFGRRGADISKHWMAAAIAGGKLNKMGGVKFTISFIPGSCLSSIFSPWKKKGLLQWKRGSFGFQVYVFLPPRKLAFWTPKTWRWMEDDFHVGVYLLMINE